MRLDAKAPSEDSTLRTGAVNRRIGGALTAVLLALLLVPALATAAAPAVTGIVPSEGPTAGGTVVTIEGTNLEGPTAVKFGGAPATEVQGLSATALTAKSPRHFPEQVDVTVTTAGGTSAVVPADRFTYKVPPRPFLETFGNAAQPSFTRPAGMAVDPASGDLYVIDLSEEGLNGTLHRFKPNGEPDDFSALGSNVIDGAGGEDATPAGEVLGNEGFFGFVETQVAIAPPGAAGGTSGDIYVTDATHGVIDVFGPSGKYLGQKAVSSFPCGVAVDPKGNVFVGDKEGAGEGVHKYTPTAPATFTESAKSPFTTSEPCQIAASEGFVYVANHSLSEPSKIASGGENEGKTQYPISTAASTLAIDPLSGDLFVAFASFEPAEVLEFDVSGGQAEANIPVSTAPLGSLALGVAVDPATAKLYATHEGGPKVEVFSLGPPPEFELAVNQTGNASGTVKCKFNGGPAESCAGPHPGGTAVTVEATAGPNSELSDLSGSGSASACSASPCSFSLREDSSITAEFNFEASVIAITGLTPNKGLSEGGNSVEIKGQNFTGAESVKFGSTPATFEVKSPALIKATAPPGSIGTVEVHVKTPGGESIATEADKYAYIPSPPAVSGVSPSKGPLAGGITVTITGANLENAEAVKFGATAATVTEDTATQIKVTAPACAEGTVHVTVKTAGGTSATSAADEYTCVPAPTVTSVSPTKGPLGGGETVTITGTNLSGAEAVKFGPNAATITEDTATLVKVTAPSCIAGALHITVTTPGGTSATGAGDEFTCIAAPTISGVSPAKGPDEGGNAIEISGLNLSAASKVEFGSTVVTSPFLSNSATKIKVKAPAHAAGKVDVKVTTVGGTSAVVPADEYAFVAPPVLTIAKAGTGSGSVTCDAGACKASYVFGTKVTLAATADAGSSFTGFSGGCSGTASCPLTLEADTTVTATFTANPPSGGGGGSTPAPAPAPAPTPAPKPLKCKKGFKKKKVHGKARCVKVKKHHRRSAQHNRVGV